MWDQIPIDSLKVAIVDAQTVRDKKRAELASLQQQVDTLQKLGQKLAKEHDSLNAEVVMLQEKLAARKTL